MTKKNTKRALLSSVLALVLCFSMLLGTTYAWFTDSVTSAGNIIKSGILDVEMSWAETPDATEWTDASVGAIFNYDKWEPGYTQVRYVKIENKGNLAFKYDIRIVPADATSADANKLAEVIDVYYAPASALPATALTRDTYKTALASVGTLNNLLNGGTAGDTIHGVLLPAGATPPDSGTWYTGEVYAIIALHMQEEAGNEYQNLSLGEGFSVQLLATQYEFEKDSFDEHYDAQADGTPDNTTFPVQIASATVTNTQQDTVISTTTATVTIPANSTGVAANDTFALTVVETVADTANITVDAGDNMKTYDVTLEKNGTEIVTEGDTVYRVDLDIGIVDLQKFYHKSDELERVTNINQLDLNKYFYDSTTGIVSFMTKSFSPFSATYLYDGGLGTASYPYLIGSGKQWYKLLTDYQGYYMGSSTDGIYVDLIGNIDITGYDISDYYSSPRNFHLNGNGFKMMNFETTIWGGEGATMYLVNTFKDLKLENCHSSNDALFSQTQNSETASVVFDNVDLDNCSAVGGAYQYYDGSASATFVNCDATNTHVTGGYMASAGFVGNISTGTLSIDNCTFGGSVVSTQSMCAGFVGQPKNDDASVIIRNSEILPGTVIRNVSADGKVAAFDGMRTNRDYAAYNNEFNGTLETVNASYAYAQGTSAAKVPYAPICTANDFSFDTVTGTLTYNGASELGKAAVQVYVTDDYIYNGTYYGGYNWFLCDPIKKENVVTGTQITGVPIVTDFYNVVSDSETPVGLKTTDTTYVDEIHNGVFYFDAQTYSWGHYMLGGTYDNQTGDAKEPTSINVYIRITVYGTDGSLNGAISGSLLKYTVDLSNHVN